MYPWPRPSSAFCMGSRSSLFFCMCSYPAGNFPVQPLSNTRCLYNTLKCPIPFPLSLPLWGCSSTHLSTPFFLLWHFLTPEQWTPSGPKTSHPSLPHMWPATWVPPCVFFAWWSTSRELWGGGGSLVCSHCYSLYGAENPSAPWITSPIPPSENPKLVQWLAVSIYLCISQVQEQSFWRQPYQVNISKHFPASKLPWMQAAFPGGLLCWGSNSVLCACWSSTLPTKLHPTSEQTQFTNTGLWQFSCFYFILFISFYFYCPFHASSFPVTPPQTPPPPSPHSPLTWWGCSSSYSPTPTSQI